MGARENSGVILSQILRGFANGLEGCQEIDRLFLAQAFEAAAATAYKAVMIPKKAIHLPLPHELFPLNDHPPQPQSDMSENRRT